MIFLAGWALPTRALPESSDTKRGDLPPLRSVSGGELVSTADPAVSIRVHRDFRYVGPQRFILRDVADAEQHLFVDADPGKRIRRMYWIQFEGFLPGATGKYDYDRRRVVALGGAEFLAEVRRYDSPPTEGSDRARVYSFLADRGYAVPTTAVRVRLVHVFGEQRRELMIIYAERSGERGELTAAGQDDLIRRALDGIVLNWQPGMSSAPPDPEE